MLYNREYWKTHQDNRLTWAAWHSDLEWHKAVGKVIADDLHKMIWDIDSSKLVDFADVLGLLNFGYIVAARDFLLKFDFKDDERESIRLWIIYRIDEAAPIKGTWNKVPIGTAKGKTFTVKNDEFGELHCTILDSHTTWDVEIKDDSPAGKKSLWFKIPVNATHMRQYEAWGQGTHTCRTELQRGSDESHNYNLDDGSRFSVRTPAAGFKTYWSVDVKYNLETKEFEWEYYKKTFTPEAVDDSK